MSGAGQLILATSKSADEMFIDPDFDAPRKAEWTP